MTPHAVIATFVQPHDADVILRALGHAGYVVRRRWCWKNFVLGKVVGIIIGRLLL